MTKIHFIKDNKDNVVEINNIGMKNIPISKDLTLMSNNTCLYKGKIYNWAVNIVPITLDINKILIIVKDTEILHIERVSNQFPFYFILDDFILDDKSWKYLPVYEYYGGVTESDIYKDMGLSESASIRDFKTRGRQITYLLNSLAKDRESVITENGEIYTEYGGMIVRHGRKHRKFVFDDTGCCSVFVPNFDSRIAIVKDRKSNRIIFKEGNDVLITEKARVLGGDIIKASKVSVLDLEDKTASTMISKIIDRECKGE